MLYGLKEKVKYQEGREKTYPWLITRLHNSSGTYDIEKGGRTVTNVRESKLSPY